MLRIPCAFLRVIVSANIHLLIACLLRCSESRHNLSVDLIPLDLDIRSEVNAPQIIKREVENTYDTRLFDIAPEYKDTYKIGSVWDGIFQIYDDSEVTKTRSVFCIFIPFIRSYVQISSKYLQSNGRLSLEIVEFIKNGDDDVYAELIREPVIFDINQLPMVSLVIVSNAVNGGHEFAIDDSFKIDICIGKVVNGDTVIDNRVHGVIYKAVRIKVQSPERHYVTVKTLTTHGIQHVDEFESIKSGGKFVYVQTTIGETVTF